MLDDPKPLPQATGRKRPPRRFFVVANPNEEVAESSTPPFNPLPPLPSTSFQHQDKPTPSPPQPSPINTNNLKQKHQPRYNPSDRTLSSPSTPTSSPALESTPPPSTPGQKSIPSIDLAQGSDRDNSQNHLISRTDNFVKKITAPFSHVRRKSSGTNVPLTAVSSPIHYDQSSFPQTQKPNPCLSETRIFVTADSGIYKVVDITGARDAAFVRERIFADMQISDENQTHFSIYRTEVGSYALGDALTDELLFDLCRDHGDAYASLKFMVSHTSAAVHEPPLDHSYPQKLYTIPPPVVVPRNNDVYSPVRSQHRSGSPSRSLSSASERIPQENGAGYDASVSDDNADAPERDPNRATIKPGSYKTTQRAVQPPLQPQSSSNLVERGRTEIAPLRIEKHHLPSVPLQPLSPGSSRFPFVEGDYTLSARRTPQTTSSDAALERERALEDSETKLEQAGQQWRVQQQEVDEKERQRTREREVQRRPQPKSRGTGSEHWTVVPSDIPHSDYKKERPTIHESPRSPPSRRNQGYNDYSSRNTPSEGRSSRRTVGTPVPTNWAVSWIAPGGKTDSRVSPTSPSLTYRGNRSMGDLRAAAAKHPTPLQPGKRGPPPPLPMTRPATSTATQEYVDPNGTQPVPRSSDPRTNLISPVSLTTRPLPVAGNSATSSTSIAGSLGLTSPSNEPCARPRSAMGNTSTSPQTSTRVHSPTNQTEQNNQSRPPPTTLSPHPYRYNHEAGFNNIIPKIVPPTPNSDDRTPETGGHERGIGNSILREPPSPATPSSPRYSASSEPSPVTMGSPVDPASTESTLKGQPRYPWIADFPGNSTMMHSSSESTVMPTRKERPDIKPLPQRPGQPLIHQSHPYASAPPLPLPPYPVSSSEIPPVTTPTTASVSASHSQLPVPKPIPQPPTPTSFPIPVPLKSTPSDDDSDSGSNAGGTLWAISDSTNSTLGTWQTTPQSDRRKSLPRLVVDPGASQVQIQKSSGPVPLPQVPQMMPPEYPPATRRPPRPPTKPPSSYPNNRTSVFNEDFRPPAEEMYERLGDFFPGHDLDEPMIEASSGGTSPTSAEAVQPFPTQDRRKHKKSIRVVANEHKRKLDRTSRITSANNANMLRKRSTKLWGSRVEEVTAEQFKNAHSALSTPAESPSEPKPIFKWVRGELIGKGTYGKVYVALNATTGEMIAVKQVEIPRTENDRNDSRQVTVVEALKFESETLKDLDHQNVVQYLGFEETPRYLSIFLEYVPGGSIASILRKHGRFSENVTKSFTSQILDGLDYLHSKGIIHRDLKADNILVEEFGHCKISDFGISKRTDDINMIGAYTSMQGSVFWMAPEVVNGQKKGYNSKIDIWSVGCVVFEMWTGERPWSGQEAVAVLLQLYQSKLGPPLPGDVALSPQANDLRKRCFAMNPDERPTAGELRQHAYLVLPPGWEFTGYS